MKKNLLLTCLFLFCLCLSAKSQIAYHDALSLKKIFSAPLNDASFAEAGKILKNYLPDNLDPDINADQVRNYFINNPFIPDAYTNYSTPATPTIVGGGINKAISSLGSLDVTNIADGFAKFLVQRTKEELSASFFQKFKEKIKEPGNEDAVLLFPQTSSTLEAIGNQIYNYEAYLNVLRESFESDINGLLSHLPVVITDGRYAVFFNANPKLKSICLSAIYIGKGLSDKTHPGEILEAFDLTNLDGISTAGNINVKASFQTFQMVSKSLKANSGTKYWIDKSSLSQLTTDPLALRIYFGLLWQQSNTLGIVFSLGKFEDILQNNLITAGSISKAGQVLSNFIGQTEILTKYIESLSVSDPSKLTFQDYYNYYNSALDLVAYSEKIKTFPGLDKLDLGTEFSDFIKISRVGGNLALAVNRKNYSSAILHVAQVYNYSFPNQNASFKQFLLKYGSFVASVSQAQNSDDVKKAIEAAVLPSGSSRIKRVTPFNVSINAYTGLFLGRENINSVDDKSGLNSYGLSAPVGIAVSRGHSLLFLGTGKTGVSTNKYGWSSSLFLTLIDLGAVAAYRFEDTETAQVPTIQLKNIFSPGLFLSTGIPKSPLSFNLGAQVGPNLRKVNNTSTVPSADISNKTYVRYSLSFCVDIPLLNLYTKD